jgi:hypothetical protein
MDQLSKIDIIKEFLLADRKRFSLALDIYENFGKITDFLKNRIYSLLEKEIKEEIPNAKITCHTWYANNQYIDINYDDELKIQIQFWNYFKSPGLTISKLDSENAAMITTKLANSIFQNDHVWVNLTNYNFNVINDLLDMYDLYCKPDLQEGLINSFKEHVLPASKTVFEVFPIIKGS